MILQQFPLHATFQGFDEEGAQQRRWNHMVNGPYLLGALYCMDVIKFAGYLAYLLRAYLCGDLV
jgi:hypothetical protein